MKTIIFFFILTIAIIGQIKMDSSYAEYMGNAVYEMHSYVTFQRPASIGDYRIGFRFSLDKDNNTYVPMGDYTINAGNRKLHYWTVITNPPFGDKFFFEPSIIPIAEQKKFEVTNVIGRLINLFAEPEIEGDLPIQKNVDVDDRIQFDIFATGENLEYEWFFRTMIDSVTWSNSNIIGGATSSSYETIPVKLSWDGRKYFVRIYNSLGEAVSRQCLLRVF